MIEIICEEMNVSTIIGLLHLLNKIVIGLGDDHDHRQELLYFGEIFDSVDCICIRSLLADVIFP